MPAHNKILRITQLLERALWKKWSDYHRRSLVGTRMCYLELLGEYAMARDLDRQVPKLQIRAALLNRFAQLGLPHTVRSA